MGRTNKPRADPRLVTRSFIYDELWQPDKEDNLELISKRSSTGSSTGSSGNSSVISTEDEGAEFDEEEDVDDGRLCLDASPEETIAWLNDLGEKELADVDWTPDFEHHSTDERPSPPSPRLSSDMLKRINRGHGTRASRFEDLLAPLRLKENEEEAPRFSKHPRSDTYEEMMEILRAWNQHVTTKTPDDTKARQALMKAMWDRITFLHQANILRWSADAHEDTCRKLVFAIHAYRPETVTFDTQDPTHLITIVIAYLGYAVPDIDDELKHRMLYNLVLERKHVAEALPPNEKRIRRFKERIADARDEGDIEGAKKCEHEFDKWYQKGLQHNCHNIIQRIKTARHNILQNALLALQELVILQTAQKLALPERISKDPELAAALKPMSIWYPERSDLRAIADAYLKSKVEEDMDNLQALLCRTSDTADDMSEEYNNHVRTSARKLSGLDVEGATGQYRKRVVRGHMRDPHNPVMMMDAKYSLGEVQKQASEMVENAGDIKDRLEEMLSAIDESFAEWDKLERLVGSDLRMGDGKMGR